MLRGKGVPISCRCFAGLAGEVVNIYHSGFGAGFLSDADRFWGLGLAPAWGDAFVLQKLEAELQMYGGNPPTAIAQL